VSSLRSPGWPLVAYYVRRYVFWMLFFAVQRALFFVIHTPAAAAAGARTVGLSFIHALALDSATTAYLLLVPFLALVVHQFSHSPRALRIGQSVERACIPIVAFICAGDTAIYGEWGVKLAFRALLPLRYPSEVASSAPKAVLVIGVTQALVSWYLARRIVTQGIQSHDTGAASRSRAALVAAICVPLVLALVMRGGTRRDPIRESDAYFSESYAANLAAVNPVWNLGHSIQVNLGSQSSRRYRFFQTPEAEQLVRRLKEPAPGRLTPVFDRARPNVMLVILESWSGAFVKELDGDPELTPGFSALIRDGLFFDQHYASGTLSHHGMRALFSGLPTSPITSQLTQPVTTGNLPFLTRDLKQAGYFTGFIFGGDLDYGNIKEYLRHGAFDRIVEGVSFASTLPRGRLGVHDEYLYPRVMEDLATTPQPFFQAVFTLSSHPPFDEPGPHPIHRDDGRDDELFNAVHYADRCLTQFMQDARQAPWYNNTIFVFVADHPRPGYYRKGYGAAEDRRVPLLVFGEPLRAALRGTRHSRITPQYDIPALILSQLGLPYDTYRWSRNPLNPQTPEFAFYSLEDGFGWIRAGSHGTFEVGQPPTGGTTPPEGKAILQTIVETSR
jgi:phosphoglycerol transferase MdoB-like AlkP superfamily enzyme